MYYIGIVIHTKGIQAFLIHPRPVADGHWPPVSPNDGVLTREAGAAAAGVAVVPVHAGAAVLAGPRLALVPLVVAVLPLPARLAAAVVPARGGGGTAGGQIHGHGG